MMKALALFLAVFSLGVVFSAPGPRDSPDFLCKNAGEAKKNTQVLEKYMKRLTQMLEDSNDQTKRSTIPRLSRTASSCCSRAWTN